MIKSHQYTWDVGYIICSHFYFISSNSKAHNFTIEFTFVFIFVFIFKSTLLFDWLTRSSGHALALLLERWERRTKGMLIWPLPK
jgi:hypothetical protein